jgi:gamma-glutamylaminecyclotransferase
MSSTQAPGGLRSNSLIDTDAELVSVRPQSMHLVFVFGTLKEGFPNFATNRGTRVAGSFKTCAAYPLYLVGVRHSPWLVNSPGTGLRVSGQVFRVDDETLAAMDRLERVSETDGYRRQVLELEGEDSPQLVSAYAYLKQPEHLVHSEIRAGPLQEYKYEHAALYRPRAAFPSGESIRSVVFF